MKTLLTIAIGMLITFQSVFANPQDELSAKYRKAHEAKSVEAFIALIEFAQDTPDWIKSAAIESFTSDSKLKITEIKFLPLDESLMRSFEHQGITYVLTAEPNMRMRISYDEAAQGEARITATTYTIGEVRGKLSILSAKPKRK